MLDRNLLSNEEPLKRNRPKVMSCSSLGRIGDSTAEAEGLLHENEGNIFLGEGKDGRRDRNSLRSFGLAGMISRGLHNAFSTGRESGRPGSFLTLPSSVLLFSSGFRFHDFHLLFMILSMTNSPSSPDVMAESVQ